jgi:hypothetical protein
MSLRRHNNGRNGYTTTQEWYGKKERPSCKAFFNARPVYIDIHKKVLRLLQLHGTPLNTQHYTPNVY